MVVTAGKTPLPTRLLSLPKMSKIATYIQDNGVMAVICFAPQALETQSPEYLAEQATPAGKVFKMHDADSIPAPYLWQQSWEYDSNFNIIANATKAKELAHAIRREKRSQEFLEYDDIVARQIPGAVETAEAARVQIRAKYALIQTAIDHADTIPQFTSILGLDEYGS